MRFKRTGSVATRLLLVAALALGAAACADDDASGGGGGSGGSGGDGGSGGSGGDGGSGGTGGGGGGGATGAIFEGIRIGDAAPGTWAIVDGSLVHSAIEDAGGALQPAIEIDVGGDVESIHLRLVSADGSFELFDGDVAVEGGVASLDLDEELLIDVPYRLEITAGGSLAWGEEPIDAVQVCFFTQDGLTGSAEADRFGPVVSHVAVGAAVANEGAPFEVIAAATDPSGVGSLTLTLAHEEAEPGHVGATAELAYDPATCLFRGEASLPTWGPDGFWYVNRVEASDRVDVAPNTSAAVLEIFTSEWLAGGAIAILPPKVLATNHTPDTEAPTLTSVTVDWTETQATLSVVAADVGAGIAAVSAQLGTDFYTGPDLALAESGGTWTVTWDLPAWAPGDAWYVAGLTLVDVAGNAYRLTGHADDFLTELNCTLWCQETPIDVMTPTFARTGQMPDETTPEVTAVSLSATTITDPAAEVILTVAITDDGGSGLDFASATVISSDDCSPDGPAIYRNVPLVEGATGWTGSLQFWPNDPRGTWTVCDISFADRAGNYGFVRAAGAGEPYTLFGMELSFSAPAVSFEAPGTPRETTLESVALSAMSIESGVLTLDLGIAEGGAGVERVEVTIGTPSWDPAERVSIAPAVHRTGESDGVATWQARFAVLPGYPAGEWLVDQIVIEHRNGGTVRYSADWDTHLFWYQPESGFGGDTEIAVPVFTRAE